MKIMKKHTIKATILTSLLSLSVFAGNGVSGGGSGLILKDGTVKFADTLQADISPSMIASTKEIEKMFFKKNRFVRTIATKNKTFFSCAVNKINKLDLGFENLWSDSLSKVRVLEVEFPLFTGANDKVLELQQLPLFADGSNKLSGLNQVALAAYSKGDLWVQKRFLKKLSNVDKCALSIHEAIRHLNFNILNLDPVSNDEIEDITMNILNDQIEEAQIKILSHYKEPVELSTASDVIFEAMTITEDLRSLKNADSLRIDLEKTSTELRNIEREIHKRYMVSSELTSLADKLLKATQMISHLMIDHYEELKASKDQIWSIHKKMNNLSYSFYSRSSVGILTTLMKNIPENLFPRLLISSSMTKKLRGLKKLDVLKMKIVKRL